MSDESDESSGVGIFPNLYEGAKHAVEQAMRWMVDNEQPAVKIKFSHGDLEFVIRVCRAEMDPVCFLSAEAVERLRV